MSKRITDTPVNKRALERAQLNKRSEPMKTLYHDQDGRAYLATDAKELVTMMRKNADFDNSPSNEAHILLVAKRVFDQFGITLSTESPESFIASMLEAGLLTEGDEDDPLL